MGFESSVDSSVGNSITSLVYSGDEIDKVIRMVGQETQHEIRTFAPGGAHTDEQISLTQARNEGIYRRGIRSRTIYLSSVRNDKKTLEHVRWLNEHGSEVRTVPTLPIRMIISDRTSAILPSNPALGMQGVVIYRDPAVLISLGALFELTWASASPLGLTLPNDNSPVAEDDRALLELLALGNIDKEIGKKMGLSERTVGRKVANVMDQLNAKTRFQAAYLALKRNWI